MANINLLKTKTEMSPELAYVQVWLSRISMVAISFVLVAGAALATGYVWLAAETKRLGETKERLVGELGRNRQTEGLLLSVKNRADAVEKIAGIQRSMGGIMTIATTIAPGDQLVSVSMDEQQQVKVLTKMATVEAAAAALSTMETMAAEKRIINPQLVGLDVDKDGNVRLTVSFVERVGRG